MSEVANSRTRNRTRVNICIGVDVQISRGCAWFACDRDRHFVDSGWFEATDIAGVQESLYCTLVWLS